MGYQYEQCIVPGHGALYVWDNHSPKGADYYCPAYHGETGVGLFYRSVWADGRWTIEPIGMTVEEAGKWQSSHSSSATSAETPSVRAAESQSSTTATSPTSRRAGPSSPLRTSLRRSLSTTTKPATKRPTSRRKGKG